MQVQSKQETDSNKDKACFVTYSAMYGMDKQPIKMKFGQNEYIRRNKQQGREEKQAMVDWNEQLLENQETCTDYHRGRYVILSAMTERVFKMIGSNPLTQETNGNKLYALE